jgi:hypothetical protein
MAVVISGYGPGVGELTFFFYSFAFEDVQQNGARNISCLAALVGTGACILSLFLATIEMDLGGLGAV